MSVTIITGATRGIGRALAAEFVAQGHTVGGCGRSAEHIAALRKELGSPHRFDTVDVTNYDAVSRWADQTIEAIGPPDLLINNAGLINAPAPLWEVSAAEFRAVLTTNVDGTANVIRAFVPAMIQRGTGVIVNLSSGWGRSTSPEVAPYCASKFAIEGLTQALSQELPDGLAAVALSPGVVDTDMLRTAWADGAAAYPKPEEWAAGAVTRLLALGPSDNGQSQTI